MQREGSQQLVVVAHYSDGSTEDVTRTTTFDSNDKEMAEASATGLITTSKLTGSVAVMARYQGQVAVFRATIPLGVPVDNLPPAKNFIDELVFAKLKALGLPPSELSDDATFLRRVTLDLAGRLPTLEESAQFAADASADKRVRRIDALLASTDYAEYFANKWNAILRNKRRSEGDRPATYAFFDWLRAELAREQALRPDRARGADGRGRTGQEPAGGLVPRSPRFVGASRGHGPAVPGPADPMRPLPPSPVREMEPAGLLRLPGVLRPGRPQGRAPVRGQERIFHRRGIAQTQNPKTGQMVKPTGLGGPPLDIGPDVDPRHELVDWMTDKQNPFFATALVNRYWKHFFGRGLVDPEDDMRVTNPASNPELLQTLARDFADHQFDLKHLVRTICNSQVYQLSAEPNRWNTDDKQNFSRYYPQRLDAEVLLDAINQVTATASSFNGVAGGTRAVALPDSGFDSYFLTVFGRPESSSACECERSGEANLAQSLHMLNSSEIQRQTDGRQQPRRRPGRRCQPAASGEGSRAVFVGLQPRTSPRRNGRRREPHRKESESQGGLRGPRLGLAEYQRIPV